MNKLIVLSLVVFISGNIIHLLYKKIKDSDRLNYTNSDNDIDKLGF